MVRKVLKQEWRAKVYNDPELQGKIAKAVNKSAPSVKRWAEKNHEMLLLSQVLETIIEYYNLPAQTILTETVLLEPDSQNSTTNP